MIAARCPPVATGLQWIDHENRDEQSLRMFSDQTTMRATMQEGFTTAAANTKTVSRALENFENNQTQVAMVGSSCKQD
ncbi:hypothetical protein K0M31_004095 [Melipona bicolor]|uniref:Uncharacterized protein n=1 Tax=Melipona bicolor TaxID=60889 RepID=A0AA40FY63_9HYME|nr:hypothetical protein K0M31_004095 [Melipona bicolor]